MNWAFIPARRGSKRVRQKNLRTVAGKPLIAYTIEAATASGVFDHVVVNSEDDEILSLAERCGAESYRRPETLATDTTYVIDVVKDMIQSLGLTDEASLGILFPTCPLRSPDDIREAYALFDRHRRVTPVVGVTAYEYPVQLALDVNAEGRLEPIFPLDYGRSTRHNDHKPMYRANFAVIVNSAANLRAQRNLIGDRPIPYVMPAERAIDIDNPFEMELVRLILEARAAAANAE